MGIYNFKQKCMKIIFWVDKIDGGGGGGGGGGGLLVSSGRIIFLLWDYIPSLNAGVGSE